MVKHENKDISLSSGFKKLRIQASIGVYPKEKRKKQALLVSLSLHYAPSKIVSLQNQDSIEYAHDYAQAAQIVCQVSLARHYELLENLALAILRDLRSAFPDCLRFDLILEKPQALKQAQNSFCSLSG